MNDAADRNYYRPSAVGGRKLDTYETLEYLRWLLHPQANLDGKQGDYVAEKFDEFTSTSTPSTPAGDSLGENESSCLQCGAAYGHFGHCPLLNRSTAEARSLVSGKVTQADILHAHALGVDLTK